jgi:hypothetical protein
MNQWIINKIFTSSISLFIVNEYLSRSTRKRMKIIALFLTWATLKVHYTTALRSSAECIRWAQDGECIKNPRYTWAHCLGACMEMSRDDQWGPPSICVSLSVSVCLSLSLSLSTSHHHACVCACVASAVISVLGGHMTVSAPRTRHTCTFTARSPVVTP